MAPSFKKSYLSLKHPEGSCQPDGYHYILKDLEEKLGQNPMGRPLDKSSYFKIKPEEPSCLKILYQTNRHVKTAQWFISHLANHDGEPRSISAFDVEYARYHLYGNQWKEDWVPGYIRTRGTGAVLEKIREYGSILWSEHSSKTLKLRAKELLTALEKRLKDSNFKLHKVQLFPTIEFFLTRQEPPLFTNFLNVSLKDFLGQDLHSKKKIFQTALTKGFPDAATVAEILPYLTPQEALLFRKTLFKKDILKAMQVFEQGINPDRPLLSLPRQTKSYESEIFPNLPVNTPYAARNKAIDQFLGKPVLTRIRNHVAGGKTVAWTTLKKYIWVGNTEVFSIESGKPGPTTLVFSPHYHEDNPRRYFHWIKDMPLLSGRVILIPEANRAMGISGRTTNPMNNIFNKALTSDRMDYLIVRRVEFLMGLVDGAVGLHDSHVGPFYISDTLASPTTISENSQGPNASLWIPKEVLQIKKMDPRMESFQTNFPYRAKIPPLQIQWKIAECSRRLLKKLSGQDFRFSPDSIIHGDSRSVTSTTGYMNYILKKPAMTFEGKKGAEHGQLHAQALTTLLFAFGHRIHPKFDEDLKKQNPKVEPQIYHGLPPVSPLPPPVPNLLEDVLTDSAHRQHHNTFPIPMPIRMF